MNTRYSKTTLRKNKKKTNQQVLKEKEKQK